ncbi:hypothetical protein ACIRNI_25325 [Streptomyces sp. NPDC093546]
MTRTRSGTTLARTATLTRTLAALTALAAVVGIPWARSQQRKKGCEPPHC